MTALVAVTCAGGVGACGDGGGSGPAAAASAGASTSEATPAATGGGAGVTASSGSGSTAANARPCDLLTAALAGRILATTVSAPEVSSPTMCEYALHGDDYGNTVAYAVEKWQEGRTVRDEVKDLALVGGGAQQPVPALGPDAVVVSGDSGITVVWKAGDVQKISVSTTGDPDAARERLLDVAREIYAAEQR